MCDHALVCEIQQQILVALRRIERRFLKIQSPNDFVSSDEGIDMLDAISMMLVAIGESCKKLDKLTEGSLFEQYPNIDWKGVKGIRDIISHHYFEINAEVVYSVCKKHIPDMKAVFEEMVKKNGLAL